jgi:hypothetical protein
VARNSLSYPKLALLELLDALREEMARAGQGGGDSGEGTQAPSFRDMHAEVRRWRATATRGGGVGREAKGRSDNDGAHAVVSG